MFPSRTTFLFAALFAAAGLFAYFVSHWLLEIGPGWMLVAVSLGRLVIGVVPAAFLARRMGWTSSGSLWAIAVAAPYPVDLALAGYWQFARAMPESLRVDWIGPTAEMIFVAAVLLSSRWLTQWAVERSAGGQTLELARRLGVVLFALTGAGVLLMGDPARSLWFLSRIAEPVALAGYSAVIGSGPTVVSRQDHLMTTVL